MSVKTIFRKDLHIFYREEYYVSNKRHFKIIRNVSTPEDLNVKSFDPIFLSKPKRVITGYKVN
jgi:hypothetical protein